MYETHVPYIASAMRQDADAFARGVTLALLSIQQMFITVPKAMIDVEQNDTASRFLFGSKAGAYHFLMEHKVGLHAACVAATSPAEVIATVATIPGIGIVKAAFVAQLMGHDVACLDTRNIQRDKRNPREYRTDGEHRKKTRAFARKIDHYVRDTGGKAREYWDTWCIDVAKTYGMTPLAVSKLHLDCVVRKTVAPIAVPFFYLSDDMPF